MILKINKTLPATCCVMLVLSIACGSDEIGVKNAKIHEHARHWFDKERRVVLSNIVPSWSVSENRYSGHIDLLKNCELEQTEKYSSIVVYTNNKTHVVITEYSQAEYADRLWADYSLALHDWPGEYGEFITREIVESKGDLANWRFDVLREKYVDVASGASDTLATQHILRLCIKSLAGPAYRGIELVRGYDFQLIYLRGFEVEGKSRIEIYQGDSVTAISIEGPDWGSIDELAACLINNLR